MRCLPLSAALAVALCVGGCASSRAPAGFLPGSARTATLSVHGAWVAFDLADGPAEGELLAADADSMYVLHAAGALRRAYSRDRVSRIHVELHRGSVPAAATVTGIGFLSTVSHGLVLILSAPVWAIGGTVAIASASRNGMRRTVPWERLSTYARYPQGLPPGLPPGAR